MWKHGKYLRHRCKSQVPTWPATEMLLSWLLTSTAEVHQGAGGAYLACHRNASVMAAEKHGCNAPRHTMGENTQLSGSLGKLGSFQYVPFTFTIWYSTCEWPWYG